MSAEGISIRALQVRSRSAVLIEDKGASLVSMQSLCDPIGLDPLTAWIDLQNYAGLKGAAKVVHEPATGTRVLCLDQSAIPYWVTTIRPDRVPERAREEHKQWCEEVVRACHAYRTKGVAVNEAMVGAEGRRQIEAIAAKYTTTEHVRVLDSALRTAVELMASDPATVGYAKLAFKSALRDAAGESGEVGSTPTHLTIRGIGIRHGFVLTPEATQLLGSPVAAAFRKLYPGEPILTNLQLGLLPELGAHSLVEVEAKAYPQKAWEMIQKMIEDRFNRDGEKCGRRISRVA